MPILSQTVSKAIGDLNYPNENCVFNRQRHVEKAAYFFEIKIEPPKVFIAKETGVGGRLSFNYRVD